MTNESRILRETEALKHAGYFSRIFLVGVRGDDLPRSEPVDDVREIIRLRAWTFHGAGVFGKIVKTLTWIIAVFLHLLPRPVACINCHSLAVLPLCAVLSLLKGTRLVYDAHELETETAGSVGARKRLARIVEWVFIRFCDRVIVVSNSIAEWYRMHYRLENVFVVRNVPQQQPDVVEPHSGLRKACGIGEGALVFLYQGLMAPGRGIHLLLDVFAEEPPDHHLVFLGYGQEVPKIQEAARRSPNIHYHPAVPPREVNRYTAGADVGISLIENVSLSYYYCLPNKLFEYIGCGLPVIVSDFPDMAQVIDETGSGWKVAVNSDALRRLVRSLSPTEIGARRNNALAHRDQFVWEKEKTFMLAAYEGLFPQL